MVVSELDQYSTGRIEWRGEEREQEMWGEGEGSEPLDASEVNRKIARLSFR